MPNVGPAEILVILVVALLVFGPNRLPEIGRQVGKAMREFRRVQATLRDEVRDVLEPASPSAATPKLPPLAEGSVEHGSVEHGSVEDGDDTPGTSESEDASAAEDAASAPDSEPRRSTRPSVGDPGGVQPDSTNG